MLSQRILNINYPTIKYDLFFFPAGDRHNQPTTTNNQKQQHKCDICERIFSKLIQLNMHKKVVHGKTPRIQESQEISSDENNKKVNNEPSISKQNDKKTITEFRCNFCLFSTENDKILKNHAFRVHKTVENYRFESNFKADNNVNNKLVKNVHENAEENKQMGAKLQEAFPNAVGGQRPDFPRLVQKFHSF